jgi:tyrosinase
MPYNDRSRYANIVYQMRKYTGQFLSGSTQTVNLFDVFQQMHAASRNGMLHGTSAFPPQHKALMWLYESALRMVCQRSGLYTVAQCCALTLPYWEWELGYVEVAGMPGGGYWGNITRTDVFQYPELMGDTTPQSGTNFIDIGIFSYDKDFDPPGQDLKRAFSFSALSNFTGPAQIRNFIVNNPTFSSFLPYIHGSLHGQIHTYIGFTMSSTGTAANDPLFYMHHCNVDRLYHLWADCHGYESITANQMTTTHYSAQNPIGTTGTPRRDPQTGNAYDVSLDKDMNFYLVSTTATFLPIADWPSPREMWPMSNGWGGLNYRYGADKLAVSLTSRCPNNVWSWVNQ